MRDLLEDVFDNQPLEPTEAARRAMRPQLRRRFYQSAGIDEQEGSFRVLLDGRPVRTPARRVLAAPSRALADAMAAEWEAQGDFVDPGRMPLTRLANTVIDGVIDQAEAVAAEIEKYLACDLILYRAEGPERLIMRQAEIWDPILDWARTALGADFVPAYGLVHRAQPPKALAAATAVIPCRASEAWQLAALHTVTTLTGSALIALALAGNAISVEAAWAAAHVDEDWNMELWGRDDLALERRAYRFAEMQAAAGLMALSRA